MSARTHLIDTRPGMGALCSNKAIGFYTDKRNQVTCLQCRKLMEASSGVHSLECQKCGSTSREAVTLTHKCEFKVGTWYKHGAGIATLTYFSKEKAILEFSDSTGDNHTIEMTLEQLRGREKVLK